LLKKNEKKNVLLTDATWFPKDKTCLFKDVTWFSKDVTYLYKDVTYLYKDVLYVYLYDVENVLLGENTDLSHVTDTL
jgi:hypothetical protein